MVLLNIFKKKEKKNEKGWRVGGMEDFMTLIRVYFQAVMANNIGITNLSVLPDLRVFKQTMKVATVNNRLGLGERNKCKKLLQELYGLPNFFFKEIDNSIHKNCHNVNDVRNYLYQFQGFTQDLMMLMGNLMKWKYRLPSIFKNTLKKLTATAINDVLTKDSWKDNGVKKTCITIRKYQHSLGYSADWMTEFVYNVVVLAKKEPKQKDDDEEKK